MYTISEEKLYGFAINFGNDKNAWQFLALEDNQTSPNVMF